MRRASRRDAARERSAARRRRRARWRDAREAAVERVADARDAAAERVADAKAAAAEQIAKVKPRLRGVSHEWAFFVSLVLGAALIVAAEGWRGAARGRDLRRQPLGAVRRQRALPRHDWQRPTARRWMRRLDHTMIFLLIAGTVTPFALLVMEPPLSTALLIAVWAGALAGTIVELVWIGPPEVGRGDRLRRRRLDRRDRLPGDRRRGRDRRRHPDRGRRRPLHDRGGHLRGPAPGPEPGRLRLPRDLPRARDRRRGGALRRGRAVRPAGLSPPLRA